MKVLLLSVVLGLLYAGQDEAQLLSNRVDYQGGNLGEVLGILVCPFWVWVMDS